MASELKSCPFCGGTDVNLHHSAKAFMSWVSCKSCGLDAPSETGVTDEEAITYWNTRPAPAATDTGLETVGVTGVMPGSSGGFTQVVFRADDVPANVAVCLRSQAEELLAAERAEKENEQYYITVLCSDIKELKADNAALTARVKELEEALDSDPSGSDLWRYWSRKACEASQKYVDEVDRAEALEAKLAAAEKALKTARPYVEDYDTRRHNSGVDETLTQIDAVLGGKPS